MLEVKSLAARRGSFHLSVDRWRVDAGEVNAVLGTNGAGKSSLFGVLAGDSSYSGSITLHGRSLGDWPRQALARHLGVLLQQAELSFSFTAAEVVALGLIPLQVGWREGMARVRDALEQTDSGHLADRAYPGLSGGERQRVNLARVLLQLSEAESPPLLLLDEPTSAQDLGHQHSLLQLASDYASERGWGVVAILHDLNLALRYADRCLLLDRGMVAAEGTPESVLSPEQVHRFWGYEPQRLIGADHGFALI